MTREEAIKEIERMKKHGWCKTEALDMAIEALKAQATLDDVSTAYENGYQQGKFVGSVIADALKKLERLTSANKTGKWVKYEGRFDYNWECSECKCSAWEKTDYCAHCGARMVGEEE